jgi:hypothetical protein
MFSSVLLCSFIIFFVHRIIEIMGSHAAMPDIDATLSQLTLEEKVSLLAGKNFWETVDIPEKGVPSVKVQKRAFVVQ